MPGALTRSSTERVEMPVHIRFLDDGGKGLLRCAPWLQELREIATLTQLGIFSATLPARVSQMRSR